MSNAPLVGYSVNGTGPIIRDGNRSDIYYIYFKQNDYTIHNDSRKPQSKVIITNENLDVYCVSVSTGIIMVRGSKGISTICGNCAMLEHGTVYLYLETGPNNVFSKFEYPSAHFTAGYNWSDVVGHVRAKYKNNKYSKVNTAWLGKEVRGTFITTNLRVIYENNWLEDLQFICSPSGYHIKRVTVSFTTNIGVTREFNRHRVNSIAEESTRYCNYNKRNDGQIKIGLPAWLLGEENMPYIESHQFDKLPSYIRDFEEDKVDDWCDIDYYLFSLTCAEFCYNKLIDKGWKPQQAREVLPLATKSQLIHTAFIDDWKHFFALRADGVSGPPHPNAALVAKPLKEEFIKRGYLNELV